MAALFFRGVETVKKGSVIAGVLALILAGAVWIGSASYPAESAFFPRAISVLIIILTVLMLIENRSIKDQQVFDWKQFDYYRTAKVCAITCVYILLMAYVGFLITTPICLFILMQVMEKGDVKMKIASSIGTTVGIYLVFEFMLDVPLPAWSF